MPGGRGSIIEPRVVQVKRMAYAGETAPRSRRDFERKLDDGWAFWGCLKAFLMLWEG